MKDYHKALVVWYRTKMAFTLICLVGIGLFVVLGVAINEYLLSILGVVGLLAMWIIINHLIDIHRPMPRFPTIKEYNNESTEN